MDNAQTLDGAADDHVEVPSRFAPGTLIGHFKIIRELGAGGMGVVFECHDPDLERRVAVKVVRGHEPGSAAGARLVREAQALARLSHPNVVAVHEVGTVDDQVFVVMELVRGGTLASWLEPGRLWRNIVATFVEAGAGLVAAHHAGLVHRDFKPSNVLVDDIGRVRVVDFGLAHSDDDEPRLALGSGAGTPEFMAPEQRAGQPIDARADQYAFAVSLQYALGPKYALDKPPGRVRSAIARALAIDPAERFPTLEAMLDELRGALRARRRRLIAIATIVALSIGPLVWIVQRRAADECSEGTRLVDELWSRGDRAALVERFTHVRPGAPVAIESTARLVDDWSAAWKLGRRAGCRADRSQRAARLACLDQNLAELRAQLSVWGLPNGELVDRAVATAAALPRPEACAQRPGTTTAIAEPTAERIARIHALVRAGRAPDAKADVQSLLPLVGVIDHPATTAAALNAAGRVAHANGELDTARGYLARAASEAGRAGDDAAMIDALLLQAVVVTDQGRPLDSLGLLDAAAALIARAGSGGSRWQERYTRVRGDALAMAGRLPEALEELRRGVALIEARAAREPAAKLELSVALGALAGAHNQRYEFETARDLMVRALAIDEEAYGPNHPEVGKSLHDLAINLSRLGRHDEALAQLHRARAIFVATYGERHSLVGGADVSFANLAIGRGNLDEARKYYERGQTVLSSVLPADHPHLAFIEEGLGSIERDSDRCAAAIPHFERAVAILERSGREHGMQLINLGACLSDVKRDAEATATLERGLAEIEKAKVADRDKSEAWALLADLAWRAGDKAKAIALAERVLAVTSDDDGPAFAALRKYVTDEQLAKWRR